MKRPATKNKNAPDYPLHALYLVTSAAPGVEDRFAMYGWSVSESLDEVLDDLRAAHIRNRHLPVAKTAEMVYQHAVYKLNPVMRRAGIQLSVGASVEADDESDSGYSITLVLVFLPANHGGSSTSLH